MWLMPDVDDEDDGWDVFVCLLGCVGMEDRIGWITGRDGMD